MLSATLSISPYFSLTVTSTGAAYLLLEQLVKNLQKLQWNTEHRKWFRTTCSNAAKLWGARRSKADKCAKKTCSHAKVDYWRKEGCIRINLNKVERPAPLNVIPLVFNIQISKNKSMLLVCGAKFTKIQSCHSRLRKPKSDMLHLLWLLGHNKRKRVVHAKGTDNKVRRLNIKKCTHSLQSEFLHSQ